MANNLTSDQLESLAGPTIDLSLSFVLNVSTPSSGLVDISSRVTTLGKTTCKLFNWNKKTSQRIQWPSIVWRVSNGDGYFSPNKPGNLWGSDSPNDCSLQMIITRGGSSTIVFINETFPIQRVEQLKDQGVANLYATTRAGARLAAEQSREGMRWEVDFDTNSVVRRLGG